MVTRPNVTDNGNWQFLFGLGNMQQAYPVVVVIIIIPVFIQYFLWLNVIVECASCLLPTKPTYCLASHIWTLVHQHPHKSCILSYEIAKSEFVLGGTPKHVTVPNVHIWTDYCGKQNNSPKGNDCKELDREFSSWLATQHESWSLNIHTRATFL